MDYALREVSAGGSVTWVAEEAGVKWFCRASNSHGAQMGGLPTLEWPLRSKQIMLATIGVILLIAWLLGFVAFNVGSGLIHILLVIAVVAIIFHFIRGRGTTVV